jgi:hypothetical protein
MYADWTNPVGITGFTTSLAVNALVTGLIVLKIRNVFLVVKTTSVEQSLGSTGGSKLRHIMFIIIESGMALLAVQLVRLVLYGVETTSESSSRDRIANIIFGVNEMVIVIIKSLNFYFFCFY